jgi:hypothetical protein
VFFRGLVKEQLEQIHKFVRASNLKRGDVSAGASSAGADLLAADIDRSKSAYCTGDIRTKDRQ